MWKRQQHFSADLRALGLFSHIQSVETFEICFKYPTNTHPNKSQ